MRLARKVYSLHPPEMEYIGKGKAVCLPMTKKASRTKFQILPSTVAATLTYLLSNVLPGSSSRSYMRPKLDNFGRLTNS